MISAHALRLRYRKLSVLGEIFQLRASNFKLSTSNPTYPPTSETPFSDFYFHKEWRKPH